MKQLTMADLDDYQHAVLAGRIALREQAAGRRLSPAQREAEQKAYLEELSGATAPPAKPRRQKVRPGGEADEDRPAWRWRRPVPHRRPRG